MIVKNETQSHNGLFASGSASQSGVENDRRPVNVGLGKIDITPEWPVRLSGYAARVKDEARDVLNRISAKAMVFGSDEQHPTVLIIVELIGLQWSFTSKVVDAISRTTGVNPEQIAVLATHTHGSPEVGNLINILQCAGDYPSDYSFSNSLLPINELTHIAAYQEVLIEKLEKVALIALKDRKPAYLSWGQTTASFAVNRRTEGGPTDPSLPVLRVVDLEGNLKAVFLNYACHGITLGPDVNAIHGDWMGLAQQVIESRYPGCLAMVAVGCAGDLHPVRRDKMEYLMSYAEEIADRVANVLLADLTALNAPPVGSMKWIKLPFAPVPTTTELIKLTEDKGIRGYFARNALEQVMRGRPLPSGLDYPIQVWNFDEKMVMFNLGGEVVTDYAKLLKNKYGEDRIWINAYANDVQSYIPSKRIIQEGGYEGETSMYWYDKPAPFLETIEENIMDALAVLIEDSFEKNDVS